VYNSNHKKHPYISSSSLGAHNDVVDGNVDQFHKEANETHDCKSNGSSDGNLLKFFPVRLGTPLDKADGVLCELLGRFKEGHYLIHGWL